MNKNKEECTSFCTRFNDLLLDVKNKSHSVHIGIAVPYTLFNSCNFDSSVAVYAQNVSDMDKGAYTGQISTHMLKDTGIYGSLVGHSEARKYQFETDAVINKKTLALINSGMKAIVCVGETLEEFEANKTLEVITRQIKIGLANVDKNYLDKVIIAYEPV
jgi:triosephosphate isomerase